MIRFNKPYATGNELKYIAEAIDAGRLSGNGKFTKLCQQYFKDHLGATKTLMTTSCTDALEMAALLLRIQPGDEVIVPSYTFVSTANAFALRGAKIVFADSEPDYPNIDAAKLESLITPKTRAIVVVHYGGAACDMDKICAIAEKYDIKIVEDAAQAIDSYYHGKPLGSLGDLSAFSFHETKNIISGEGGLLAVNRAKYADRAEIIWEKGTNRSAFYRGEVDKYSWVDIGSSYLPTEMVSAFLWAQIEALDGIQSRRKEIWQGYSHKLEPLENQGKVKLMRLKDYHTNNGHLFYILTENIDERDRLLAFMRENEVGAVFHYLTLHDSPYFKDQYSGAPLAHAKYFADTLVRLPLYAELTDADQDHVCTLLTKYYSS